MHVARKESDVIQCSNAENARCGMILWHVQMHPFSMLNEICNGSGASHNWDDVKRNVDELCGMRMLCCTSYFGSKVYHTNCLEGGFNLTFRTFLRIKDAVLSHIESDCKTAKTKGYMEFLEFYGLDDITSMPRSKFKKRLRRYRHGINSEDVLSQIISKSLDIYYLKTKILIKEEDTASCNACRAKRIRQGRIGEISEFLNSVGMFLRYGPDRHRFDSISDFSKFLDNTYVTDLQYFKRIVSKTRWDSYSKTASHRIAISETKKDASERFGIKMKQMGKVLKPLRDVEGRIDFATIAKSRAKEDAVPRCFARTQDIEECMYLERAIEFLQNARKGTKEYRQALEETRMFFPDVNWDHVIT